uniref:Non-specific serine/threonine protein kinase n=2 Tax=Mesocestoides corti TaxID=53468 RepID=A0A5K3EEZ5_MESCO
MSGKRKHALSESDFDYLNGLAKEYAKNNIFDAKGIMILCKSLFPNNVRVKVLEYEIAKEMGNFKHASGILADSYHLRNARWEAEVNNIFAGLQSVPVDQHYLRLFIALPQHSQVEVLMDYCSSSLTTASSKAEFLLRFVTEKFEILGENSFIGSLFDNLIELLMVAEMEHWQSLNRAAEMDAQNQSDSPINEKQISPTVCTEDIQQTSKDCSGYLEPDEGEEGEVLEEADDDDGEVLDDDDLDNHNPNSLGGKNSANQTFSVLNVHRMRLACDVLPLVHRVRGTIKFSSTQLQSLVINAFQFLLTFAAQIPFTDDGFPEISGASTPLPELLKLDPSKYLRLFLDMAADLLKWPISGPSFQVQPRSDILEMLQKCHRVYKDLEHDFQRQKASSGSINKKRSSSTTQKLSSAASQIVCTLWALFVEVGVAFTKESKALARIPFDISTLTSLDKCNLPNDDALSEPLLMLQSLWSLRTLYRTQNKSPVCKPPSHQSESILESLDASLQPQDGAHGLKSGSLLEFVVRINLTMACLIDSSFDFTWHEGIFSNSNLLSRAYSQEQLLMIQCLLDVVKLHHEALTHSKPLASERSRFLLRVLDIRIDEATNLNNWTKFSNRVIGLSTTSFVATFEVCLAVLEQWLIENVKQNTHSITIACIAFVLHQNPLWMSLPKSKNRPVDDVISCLFSNWRTARRLFTEWLKSGFICDPNLLTQLVRMENSSKKVERTNTEFYYFSDVNEFLDLCFALIQAPNPPGITLSLARFIKQEANHITSCISA